MILTTTPKVQIAPKLVIVYTYKGKSKSFSMSFLLIHKDTDTEHDPNYVPPGTTTPTISSLSTRRTPPESKF